MQKYNIINIKFSIVKVKHVRIIILKVSSKKINANIEYIFFILKKTSISLSFFLAER